MLRWRLGKKDWVLSSLVVVGLSVVLLWGCGSFGGKKGKPSVGAPFQPVSLNSGNLTGRGMLSVRVNITRAIPEVNAVQVIVLGEGLTEAPLTATIFVPQELSTTFKDVPIGLKWVIVGAVGSGGNILGMSAKAVNVQDGMQTTATLNLSLSQRVVDITEKVSGATTVTDFGTPAPIEVRRTNGTVGFYSNNFNPPKIQPVTTLWHGYKTADGNLFRFDPPVTYIQNEADPSQPLSAGEFQPGQQLQTTTTLRGPNNLSESQTVRVDFLSWQAAFLLTGVSVGGIQSVPNAAHRVVKVSGNTNPMQWVEWLKRGFGPVVRLDIDPNASIGDGTVPTRIWVAYQKSGDFFPSSSSEGGLFYPLDLTHERRFTVSPGTGAGDINVTVDLPFGLVACDADPDAGIVYVRYSLPVDTTPNGANSAINLANYALSVDNTPLSLTGAAAEAISDREIAIQGLSGLVPGATLKVVVRNIKTRDGTKTIDDPNGTTRDDPTDPNVCVTEIRSVPFRIDFAFATDDPTQAVRIEFNRPVDPTTALNKANYRLESPPGTVIDLSPNSIVAEIDRNDPSVVIFEGVRLTAGQLFVVTVTGVKDFKGNTIPNDGISNRAKGTVQKVSARQLVVASAFADDTGTVTVDFALSPSGGANLDPATASNRNNYTIESPLGTTVAGGTVNLLDNNTVQISGLSLTKDNLCRITVRNLRTVEGFVLLEDGIRNVVKVTVQDRTPPRATVARFFTTAPHVEIEFNEPLDISSAQAPFNYSVRATDNSEFPNVQSATYDGTKVSLTLDANLTAGKEYEVRVRAFGVRDLAGNTPTNDQTLTGTAQNRTP